MADGSRAAAQQRLQAAGYTKHRPQHEPRCSNCTHVQLSGALIGATQHDRYCGLLKAGVKTHGGCRVHKTAAEVAR